MSSSTAKIGMHVPFVAMENKRDAMFRPGLVACGDWALSSVGVLRDHYVPQLAITHAS